MKQITFGRFLVEARDALEISAAEAARRCNVSRSHWSHMEHDRRLPDLDCMYSMARLFRVPMERMYELAHPEVRR